MGEIIEIPKKWQWASGEAFCIGCDHTWAAVAPTGTTQLLCPNCGTEKGTWKFPFQLPDGELIRECQCGNRLFYITPEGHMCIRCGIYQIY